MKVDFLVAWMWVAVPVFPVASVQPAPQQPPARVAPADVQAALAKVRATVQDPFVTEAALASARAELDRLRAQVGEADPPGAKRQHAAGPAADAALEIRKLLALVEGRIGRGGEPVASPPRNLRAAGFAVPQFEDGRDTHARANALRASQARLAEHLRGAAPGTEQAEDLLVAMVVAEEQLAWQAGWPFTPDEARELKVLKDQAAKAGTAKGDTALRNEIDRRIGEIYARRRDRGISVINARLNQEAAEVGRPASPPFVIHRPTTRGGQRAVEQRLAEAIAAETGVQLQPGGPALLMLSLGTKPFDDIVASSLRGDR